jgi:Ankyrin repeats (3 copies)
MECLRVLLEEGVNAYSDGNTPLHFAATSGNLDAALCLIDSLPNPNRKSAFVHATNANARMALFLAGHRFMDSLFSKEIASRYNSTDFRDVILRLGEHDQESHPHLMMGLKTRHIHELREFFEGDIGARPAGLMEEATRDLGLLPEERDMMGAIFHEVWESYNKLTQAEKMKVSLSGTDSDRVWNVEI